MTDSWKEKLKANLGISRLRNSLKNTVATLQKNEERKSTTTMTANTHELLHLIHLNSGNNVIRNPLLNFKRGKLILIQF